MTSKTRKRVARKAPHTASAGPAVASLFADIDNHKLGLHPARVAEWLKKGDCPPLYVEMGVTNRCNHRCVFCALDWIHSPKTDLDTDIVFKALEDMAGFGVKSIMFAGEGEPLLHKDIARILIKANRCGFDVAMTTNGVRFSRSIAEQCLPNLKWIRFSVDAGTESTYAKVHGAPPADFTRVISAIRDAVEIRNARRLDTTIGMQYLLIPQNAREVTGLARIARSIGVDNLQVKPYSQHPDSRNRFAVNYRMYGRTLSDLEKMSSDTFRVIVRARAMQRIEDQPRYNECRGLSFFALIDAHGNVIPCNIYYNKKEFIFGNLYEKHFPQIWRSDTRKEVLRRLVEQGVDKCRKACRLDVINIYLHRLLHPHPHDNFI